MKKKLPAITFNFIDEIDKIETSNIIKNIKSLTGYDNPVILNRALRLYYKKLLQ